MFLEVVLTLVLFYCILLRWKMRYKIGFSNKFKCVIRAIPILGHAYLFLNCKNDKDRLNVLKLFGEHAIKEGGAICSWNLHKLYFIVADPVLAECLMKNCLGKDDAMKTAMELMQNATFVADVSEWRPRRKVLASTFNHKCLLQFDKIFSKQSMILIEQLQKTAGQRSISLSDYIINYSMDCLCETTQGVEIHAQKNPEQKILKAFSESSQLISERIIKPWLHLTPIYKLTSSYRQFKNHVDTIYSFVQKVITDKRVELNKKSQSEDRMYDIKEHRLKSFLELMIETSDYNDKMLKEEAVELFIAGTDPSALAASFVCVLLARHPTVQEKVFNELREVFGDSKRPVLYEDLINLKYLEATIKEGLRLYPPALILLRKVKNDVCLPSGDILPEDMGIIVSVYGIHRNPAYWGDDVEQFRPERFFEAPPKHPAAFMPFSNGPRNCVGNVYAMLSVKTVLATLLRHYRILPNCETELGQPIDVKFDIMLRATDGFKVILEPLP